MGSNYVSAVRRLYWGVRFWRFAGLYFLAPWSGLAASLGMRRDGAPWPIWFRVSHVAANWTFFAFQLVMIWLWIRALQGDDWVAAVVLPFPALTNFLVLTLRLQTVYKFSGQTAAARGDWHDSP